MTCGFLQSAVLSNTSLEYILCGGGNGKLVIVFLGMPLGHLGFSQVIDYGF